MDGYAQVVFDRVIIEKIEVEVLPLLVPLLIPQLSFIIRESPVVVRFIRETLDATSGKSFFSDSVTARYPNSRVHFRIPTLRAVTLYNFLVTMPDTSRPEKLENRKSTRPGIFFLLPRDVTAHWKSFKRPFFL